MEGTWPITLLEPRPDTIGADYGERTPTDPIRHTDLWATRRDRGGREGVDAGVEVGEWTVLFEVRLWPSIEGCSHTWRLESEGVVWDIERVNLAHIPGGERRLQLLCLQRR